ncbi:MAG TPA: Rrf2 family transcriptional regulator [Ktedonobacterales bacterium]|nr:Rrf2 family transcriptional regulator [Ktedonobacterales bacterium]
MLRVSTKGEYGVRLLVDLARHYGESARSLTEISQSQGLELKLQYLEQLARALRENGFVESTRGAHGGYRLSRPPEDVRMGEVVRALEGPIAPMICATEGDMEVLCEWLDGCSTKFLWARVRDAIAAALDATTLADLVRDADAERDLLAARRAVLGGPDGALGLAGGVRLVTTIPVSPRVSAAHALGQLAEQAQGE